MFIYRDYSLFQTLPNHLLLVTNGPMIVSSQVVKSLMVARSFQTKVLIVTNLTLCPLKSTTACYSTSLASSLLQKHVTYHTQKTGQGFSLYFNLFALMQRDNCHRYENSTVATFCQFTWTIMFLSSCQVMHSSFGIIGTKTCESECKR